MNLSRSQFLKSMVTAIVAVPTLLASSKGNIAARSHPKTSHYSKLWEVSWKRSQNPNHTHYRIVVPFYSGMEKEIGVTTNTFMHVETDGRTPEMAEWYRVYEISDSRTLHLTRTIPHTVRPIS